MYTNLFNLPGRSNSAFLQKTFLAIVFIITVTSLKAQDFEGSWNITHAKGMSGNAYGGEISFRQLSTFAYGVSTYNVTWVGTAANYNAVALKVDNTLYAGYATGQNSNYGIVVYRATDNGNLSGVWTGNGFNGATGSELIAGYAKNLDGVYTVSGQNPDGNYYTGSITIRPSGQVYTCTWNIGEITYNGIGILKDGIFAVGYGTSNDYGLAQYQLNANKNAATGTWTQAGASVISYEDIQKQ